MNPSVVKKTRLWMAGLLLLVTSASYSQSEFSEETCHLENTRCKVIVPSPENLESLRAYKPLVPSRIDFDQRSLVETNTQEWQLSNSCVKAGPQKIVTPGVICEDVRKKCASEFETSTCSDLRPYVLHGRFSSSAIRMNAFDELLAFSTSTIADLSVQDDCCRGLPVGSCEHEACRQKFSETRILLAQYTPHGAIPASAWTTAWYMHMNHTNPDLRHSIVFDEASALSQLTKARIERQVLHEAGHACESSIWYAEKTCRASEKREMEGLDANLYSCKEGVPLSVRHLKMIAGDKAASCITDELASLATQQNTKNKGERPMPYCESSWYQEAFADLVFIHRWKTLAHWGMSCSDEWQNRIGPGHAPQKIHFKCTLFDEKFMASFCDGAPPPRYPVETKKPEPEPATKKN